MVCRRFNHTKREARKLHEPPHPGTVTMDRSAPFRPQVGYPVNADARTAGPGDTGRPITISVSQSQRAPETTDHPGFDLLIVGGGVNGVGIARDAAGRGLSVGLCEQADLANYTSSASTKLIHGGLRYLEHYEFALVRKSLQERELLLGIAPHIIWPLRFILPHVRELRPYWLIRAGLLLYDHLAGVGSLPRSRGIDLSKHPAGAALDPALHKGFAYSDCWVQDARLVILNALDAAERGAAIWPRTRCVAATRDETGWHATLRSMVDGSEREVRARALVNAAGPWAGHLLDHTTGHPMQLVKGSHVLVPRLFDHDHAYIFQHTDGRVVFALPYEGDFTLIGTTEVPYDDDPALAEISPKEIEYLCAAVNRYLDKPVRPSDVVSTYSGVRPLYGEANGGNTSDVSRDYALELDTDGPALLTVLGGKLTTYRRLARDAIDALRPIVGGTERDWTGTTALPGGDVAGGDFDAFLSHVQQRWPWLPETLARRLARNYGTRIDRILGHARELGDLGACLGADLYEAELDYIMEQEWAVTAEDVLWRRTKLGLRLDADERSALARAMAVRARRGAGSASSLAR